MLKRASSPLTKLLPAVSPPNKKTACAVFLIVGGRGLEPPLLSELAPKASVSTISPPAQAGSSRTQEGYRSLHDQYPRWIFSRDYTRKNAQRGFDPSRKPLWWLPLGAQIKKPTSVLLICAPRRDRTSDLILKRDLLYQLSYGCESNYPSKNNGKNKDFLCPGSESNRHAFLKGRGF